MNAFRFAMFVLAGAVTSIPAIAQTNGPSPVLPDQLVWASPRPGVQLAWVVGADKTAGLIFFASNSRPEHWSLRTRIRMSATALS